MVCHAVCPPQRAAAAAAASKWTTGRGNLSGWTAEEKLDAAANVVVRHMLGGDSCVSSSVETAGRLPHTTCFLCSPHVRSSCT